MTWKAYAAVSGAGLLATYLASAPPAIAPGRNVPRPSVDVRPPVPLTVDIQAQALKLQTRIAHDTGYENPSRDPFRFAARPSTARRQPSQPVIPAAPPLPVAPEPPPIRLSGIATQMVGGEPQRTAILVTPQGPLEVHEGDAIGTDYHVTRIQDDAVELTGTNGIIRRLALRP